jgi:hypothetical protein
LTRIERRGANQTSGESVATLPIFHIRLRVENWTKQSAEARIRAPAALMCLICFPRLQARNAAFKKRLDTQGSSREFRPFQTRKRHPLRPSPPPLPMSLPLASYGLLLPVQAALRLTAHRCSLSKVKPQYSAHALALRTASKLRTSLDQVQTSVPVAVAPTNRGLLASSEPAETLRASDRHVSRHLVSQLSKRRVVLARSS